MLSFFNLPSSVPKSPPPLRARPLPYRRRIRSALRRIARNVFGDISKRHKCSVTSTDLEQTGLIVPVYPPSTLSSNSDSDHHDEVVVIPKHGAPTNFIGDNILSGEHKIHERPQFPQAVLFKMDIPANMCPIGVYEAMVNHACTYRSLPPCFPPYCSYPVDNAQSTYWHIITRDGSNMTLKWTNEFTDPNYRFEHEKEQLALRRLRGMRGVPQVLGRVEVPGEVSVFMSNIGHISLRELMARVGTLDKRTAVWLMAQVLMTIHRMHARGVIHFDINPDTIMINNAGRVTICEFTKSYVFPEDWDKEDSLPMLDTDYPSSHPGRHYFVPWPATYRNHRYTPCATSGTEQLASFRVDINAAACIWHEVRTSTLPQALVTGMGDGKGYAFRSDILSVDEQDFLSTLLDGSDRSLCLMDMMFHPVFEGIEWERI